MRRGTAILLLVGVVVAVLWVAYSGRAFLWTRDVVLPQAVEEEVGSGYYNTRFDDGYLNAPASEAKLGTALVTAVLLGRPLERAGRWSRYRARRVGAHVRTPG